MSGRIRPARWRAGLNASLIDTGLRDRPLLDGYARGEQPPALLPILDFDIGSGLDGAFQLCLTGDEKRLTDGLPLPADFDCKGVFLACDYAALFFAASNLGRGMGGRTMARVSTVIVLRKRRAGGREQQHHGQQDSHPLKLRTIRHISHAGSTQETTSRTGMD